MAMKQVTIFVLVAAFSVAIAAASAKTVTTPQSNANDQSVNAVAGPPPAIVWRVTNPQPSPAKRP
jgi:hypothetical protein